MIQNEEKKAYQAPKLTVHGEVKEVTQASDTPTNFPDAAFAMKDGRITGFSS